MKTFFKRRAKKQRKVREEGRWSTEWLKRWSNLSVLREGRKSTLWSNIKLKERERREEGRMWSTGELNLRPKVKCKEEEGRNEEEGGPRSRKSKKWERKMKYTLFLCFHYCGFVPFKSEFIVGTPNYLISKNK